jgi:cell division protein FtsI/penicillin-binding protein 2
MRRSSSPPLSPTRRRSSFLRRTLCFCGFLAFWILCIVGRLYQLQVIEYVKWVSVAEKQQQRTVLVPAKRGAIYDRRGRPLALSLRAYTVYASPTEVSNAATEAALLAPVVGVTAGDLQDRLRHASRAFSIKRQISKDLAERIRNLNLRGIGVQNDIKRSYPNKTLAAGVLGFVGSDDQGLAGLESGLNTLVEGTPFRMLLNVDGRDHSFHSTGGAEAGADVVLTLDENIQQFAENALADAVGSHHAAGGTAIVEDPSTGQILAMASEPTFDPNDYRASTPDELRNQAIQWVYEPGSMFKLVTYSAALEEGLISPDEMIDCQNGSITVDGHVIHDDERFGVMTVEQALAHSSDVAAIKIGLRLGPERFYHYIRQYGFGSRTGIRLPGEEQGLLEPPERWSGISIGAISMGQEVGVTALQVLSAYSAIANGGVQMPPRILLGPARLQSPERAPRTVISARTAEMMRHMLTAVVEEGTGKGAQLEGYSAAGKTGTAQKVVGGVYSHTKYVSSFVGFAPVDRPAIAVLVSIDSPEGAYYGAEVAAPVFKQIAERTLAYLNVPKDRPAPPLLAQAGKPPAPNPPHAPAKSAAAADPDVPPILDYGPSPPAGYLPGGSASTLRPVVLGNDSAARTPGPVVLEKGPLVRVPDFTGLAARPVADQCEAAGLDLAVSGSGLAVQQYPVADSKVPPGTRVWVRFAR